jgi:uncharacterized repeat protein (TIGR01451 family)
MALLAALIGLAAWVAFPMTPASATSGHIQVGPTTDGNNNPMQACGIKVEFFGYGAGAHTGVVAFSASSPSSGTPVVIVAASDPQTFPFTGNDGVADYYINTSAMTSNSAHGFHITVNTTVDGGTTETHTIYIDACDVTLSVVKAGPTGAGNVKNPGDTFSYTLTVSNSGNAPANSFVVTDDLPTGLTMTNPPSGPGFDCTASTSTSVSCSYSGSLTTGTAVVTVPVQISSTFTGTSLSNTGAVNQTSSNTVVTTVHQSPVLGVVKVGPTGAAQAKNPGDTFSYTLTVTNSGYGPASTFTVTDALPTGLTTTSLPSGSGFTCTASSSTNVVCTWGGTLAPSGTAVLTVPVQLSSTFTGTSITNTGAVNGTNSNDVVTTVNQSPSLSVVKAGPTGAAQVKHPGDTYSYTLTVSNSGNAAATSFTVTDALPAGLTTTSPPSGTTGFDCTASTATNVSCAFSGSLTTGTAVVTVPVQISSTFTGTSLSNTGAVDNTSSNTVVTTVEPNPSAEVTKTNNANGDDQFSTAEEAPAVSQPVTFKLHVKNTSPYAINVGQSISDLVWVGAEPTQETAPTTYSCLPAITNLAPNAAADCTFTADSYAPADGVTKSDRATVTLTKYTAPVSSLRRLTAAVVAAPPSFTATSNVSTVKTNVPLTRVAAVAPSVTPSQCVNGVATAPSYTVPVTPGVVYSPAVGGVGVAGTTTTVTATAAPGFVLTNPNDSPFTVTFGPAAPNCAPPPPPPVTPTPPPSPAPDQNLGVSKTGPGSAHPGDELVYTIDVTNVKGTPATAFTVTDVLPAGLSYSSADGTGFTCANAGQAVTCVYSGTLAVGQQASIIVRALLDSAYAGKTVANTVIVDPGRADTDATDNASTATTDVVAAPITGGGGGAAEEPSPSPSAEPTGGGGGGGGVGLPFTGANSEQVLQLGVGLLLAGLFLVLVMRRRRDATE